MKIGIIKEGKVPIDKRVPITPAQARFLSDHYPVEIKVESSEIRCFSDNDYENAGINVVSNLNDCDIIMGVKEVPIEKLIPEKTYFFFSHTIKKQAYNRDLLLEILKRKIQLVDWETITDREGKRLIAFGRWAGIVGAYNGLWAFGKRYNLFTIRRAHETFNYEDLKTDFHKIHLPKIKIALTGGGRVAKGAMEVLHGVGIRKVTPHDFIYERFDEPVFTQLNSRDYHKKIDGTDFLRNEFYTHPHYYVSDFLKYGKVTDLMIACAYWDPAAPVLFHREDILKDDFNIRVIADITCDIDGSIPSTKRASTIDDPIYDYNPSEDEIEKPFSDEGNLTVMAVDNLPCELPRDASESFGNELIQHVIPQLLNGDKDHVIERATITKNGSLTGIYEYLKEFIEGK